MVEIMRKAILCLDFDGVLHSYSSGWKGASVIPDPPVEGALEFVFNALKKFDVHILSSRSHQWGGRRAMKRWFKHHLVTLGVAGDPIPEWWRNYLYENSMMEPWNETVNECADQIIKRIKWPIFKPAATVSIDDRALTFTGTWPTIQELTSFKPWNKR